MFQSFAAYYGVRVPWSEAESRIVPAVLNPGDTTLDIGANVGQYTLQMARLVGPTGRVFAFEPYGPSYARLKRVVRWTGANNVTPRPVALYDRRMTAALSVPRSTVLGEKDAFVRLQRPEDTGTTAAEGTVEVHTLDEEVAKLGLDRLDFVKCDAEGSEQAIFEGGVRTVQRFRPPILCEVEERWARLHATTAEGTLRSIAALGGYEVLGLNGRSLVPIPRPETQRYLYLFVRESEIPEIRSRLERLAI